MYSNLASEIVSTIEIGVRQPPPTAGYRTIIIDDCALVREGLRHAFRATDFEVIAAAPDAKSLGIDDDLDGSPLLVIASTSDNPAADARTVQQLLGRFPGSLIVALCQDCSPKHAGLLLRAGAAAILPAPQRAEEIIAALELVILGQRVVPVHLIAACMTAEEAGAPDALDPCMPMKLFADTDHNAIRLSLREIEILQCLLAGESNRSVARRLVIAEATVKVHIKAILRKIKVKNRTQAAIWAVANMGRHQVRSAGPSLLEGSANRPVL